MTSNTPETEANSYPQDAVAGRTDLDIIDPTQARTLPGLFRERVRRSPKAVAYREYDRYAESWRDYTWRQIATDVARWRMALTQERLAPGDRVAIRLRNCRHWVIFEQAAMACGLVVVPLYVDDRADNVAYSINDSGSKMLLLESEAQWNDLADVHNGMTGVDRVVLLDFSGSLKDGWVIGVDQWLSVEYPEPRPDVESAPDELATIVYTSGTTGAPKGVMLSHWNILANAHMGLRSVAVKPSDIFLSFLPLSHTLERTVGYYVPMMAGAAVVYARSISQLAEDMLAVRPTGLISVPRIFERAYQRIRAQLDEGSKFKRGLFDLTVKIGWEHFEYRQGRGPWRPIILLWPLMDKLVAKKVRARFGGRLRVVVSGGAPLPPVVGRVFVSLGIHLLQGYGLTETSPSLSINTLERNVPWSIGLPLPGVGLRIGENQELLAKGANVMLGYWQNEQATKDTIDQDGWLHTGDCARIDDGFIYITGRLKEILVLSNGEKVPPADMEAAIAEDSLFAQSMVVGEGRSYLSTIVVLDQRRWSSLAAELNVRPDGADALRGDEVRQALLDRIGACIDAFPGYAKIYAVTATLEPWTVENGMLTPTLKLKRPKIAEHFAQDIERMYAGH